MKHGTNLCVFSRTATKTYLSINTVSYCNMHSITKTTCLFRPKVTVLVQKLQLYLDLTDFISRVKNQSELLVVKETTRQVNHCWRQKVF